MALAADLGLTKKLSIIYNKKDFKLNILRDELKVHSAKIWRSSIHQVSL